MMKKRILSAAAALALAAGLALGCFAAQPAEVVYTGSRLECSGAMGGFEQLLPGVPGQGSITLVNSSGERANFYMSTQVLETLQSQTLSGAGYQVTLQCGDTVLFGSDGSGASGTLVGGEDTAELETLNSQLEGYRLVAALDGGQSTAVTLSILSEGESVNNDYQNALGSIQFQFIAERAETPTDHETNIVYETVTGESQVVRQVQYLYRAAQTGDSYVLYICIGLVAAAAVVLLLTRKKKGDK